MAQIKQVCLLVSFLSLFGMQAASCSQSREPQGSPYAKYLLYRGNKHVCAFYKKTLKRRVAEDLSVYVDTYQQSVMMEEYERSHEIHVALKAFVDACLASNMVMPMTPEQMDLLPDIDIEDFVDYLQEPLGLVLLSENLSSDAIGKAIDDFWIRVIKVEDTIWDTLLIKTPVYTATVNDFLCLLFGELAQLISFFDPDNNPIGMRLKMVETLRQLHLAVEQKKINSNQASVDLWQMCENMFSHAYQVACSAYPQEMVCNLGPDPEGLNELKSILSGMNRLSLLG